MYFNVFVKTNNMADSFTAFISYKRNFSNPLKLKSGMTLLSLQACLESFPLLRSTLSMIVAISITLWRTQTAGGCLALRPCT